MSNTVNCEYFIGKLFLDSLAYAKLKRAKIYAQLSSTGSFVGKLFNVKIYHVKYS